MADREVNHPAGCGYGLLGLCCDSCLSGPCRRSPFDDAVEAVCGEDRDWIVANNLMERVLRESLRAMAAFRDGLERASVADSRIGAPRLEELRLLLSPSPGDRTRRWRRSTPSRPFPRSTPWAPPGGPGWRSSWMRPPPAHPRGASAEAILADALRLSAIAVAAEALSRELAGPATVEDFILPEAPSPLLRHRRGREGQPRCRAGIAVDGDRGDLQERGADLPLTKRCPPARFRPGGVREMGNPPLHDREHRPRRLVIDDPGLGALALGFSLVAIPGYPIGGSPRVEGYLTEQMRKQLRPRLSEHPPPGGCRRCRPQEPRAMRYLVVGSGPAGISAAEEIRKGDPEGTITMITADAHPATSPVMLTYWVSGRYPAERLFFRDMDSWAGEHRVELRCGERAAAVDVQRQAVTLSGRRGSPLRPAPRRHRGDPRHPAHPRHRGQGGVSLSDPCRRGGDPDLPPGGRSRHHGGRLHRDKTGLPPAGAGHQGRRLRKGTAPRLPDLRPAGLRHRQGAPARPRPDRGDRHGDRGNRIFRRVGIGGASGGRQAVPSPDSRRCGGGAAEHRAPGCRSRHNAGEGSR